MKTPANTSTRPYLIRALYEWCTDNGFTPYVAVSVDAAVQVPREYVQNNEIVLNIGFDATSSLTLGNEFIEFKARFGGSAREILVPITHVIAIYARENGQGMAFPVETAERNVDVTELQVQAVIDPTAIMDAGPDATSGPVTPKLIQLVGGLKEISTTDISKHEKPDQSSKPEPPEPPSRPRPSLKRVK